MKTHNLVLCVFCVILGVAIGIVLTHVCSYQTFFAEGVGRIQWETLLGVFAAFITVFFLWRQNASAEKQARDLRDREAKASRAVLSPAINSVIVCIWQHVDVYKKLLGEIEVGKNLDINKQVVKSVTFNMVSDDIIKILRDSVLYTEPKLSEVICDIIYKYSIEYANCENIYKNIYMKCDDDDFHHLIIQSAIKSRDLYAKCVSVLPYVRGASAEMKCVSNRDVKEFYRMCGSVDFENLIDEHTKNERKRQDKSKMCRTVNNALSRKFME